MSKGRSVGELRYSIRKSRQSNRFMSWLAGSQTGIGAFMIVVTDGGWGWAWFTVGFILLLLYRVLMVVNDITLKKLEGLPDDF